MSYAEHTIDTNQTRHQITGTNYIGGLIVYESISPSPTINSQSHTAVEGNGFVIGVLAESNYGSNSTRIGDLIDTFSPRRVTIDTNCATRNVIGGSGCGILGYLEDSDNALKYNYTNDLISDTSIVGGLVGNVFSGSPLVSKEKYWNKDAQRPTNNGLIRSIYDRAAHSDNTRTIPLTLVLPGNYALLLESPRFEN